jgi:hypothetical protein
MDVTGRHIKTLKDNDLSNSKNTIQLYLETIQQGIYFLKITGNNNTSVTKKIIKQ